MKDLVRLLIVTFLHTPSFRVGDPSIKEFYVPFRDAVYDRFGFLFV